MFSTACSDHYDLILSVYQEYTDLTYLGELFNVKNMYQVENDDSLFPCSLLFFKVDLISGIRC